ncbi:cytochrome c menaquinol dehydrogenase TorC [Rhodovastum atsumiense]|uniref:Cytochrome c-type protein n=1 Tax=Rhodovastum atsumiense TaxID=504468 RepID=A0A5M6J1K4_9PROT|nr:NapC/NirT family cytochrome c [Rhodovastum atsumiense]KAA5613528.1 cytochrome C [Rhodovastum atsumiense]CAH2603278.1 cytochrome c menaquinol dehydrogenase TorC [Rhodovastum atsumiense]
MLAWLRRSWRKPVFRIGLGGAAAVVAVAVGATVVAGGAVGVALQRTSTLEFCVSCHTMQKPYVEYQASPHYRNASGVRAICADCHVPHETGPKLLAKLQAVKDVWAEWRGTIDTEEKFERNRLRMAKQVWARMQANDSRECRACHLATAMDPHKQKPKAEQMTKGLANGETCISCHKGIAHHLPDMSQGARQMFSDLQATAAQTTARAGDVLYPLATMPLYVQRPDDQETPSDGRFIAATALKVLASEGDFLQVRIEGWRQQGADRMIYALQGKRIFAVALGPRALEAVQAGESMTDPDTDQVWTPATLTAWVRKGGMVADLGAIWAYGEEMYGSSCGTCHALSPTDHFLANQWIGTVNSMRDRITLDDEQVRLMQKYLQLHARDVVADASAKVH